MAEAKKKKKYKVIYDRNGCIGAAACAAVLPEMWEMSSSDGKADLDDGKEQDSVGIFEAEFTKEQLEKVISSAEVCPVNVIQIYDADGNKII